MRQITTESGWVLEEPLIKTNLGLYGFVLKKGDVCSYIEGRRNNRWCCYKKFSERCRSSQDGAILYIKGSPFKANSMDDALLHIGMSREEKNEIVSCYYKEYAAG